MKLERGLINYREALNNGSISYSNTIFLFTGNSYITRDGNLVMGRGAALAVKNAFPALPEIFGAHIRAEGKSSSIPLVKGFPHYGLCILPRVYLGVFQVKYHFMSDADLNLIAYSTYLLTEYLKANPTKKVIMNFPGIGYGRRHSNDVLPIIQMLSDSVTIFKTGKFTPEELQHINEQKSDC